MTAKHLSDGRWAELIAAAHFVARGWCVFSNVSHFGFADLVVARPHGRVMAIYPVEVRYHGQKHRTVAQKYTNRVQECHVSMDGTVDCELTRYKPQRET